MGCCSSGCAHLWGTRGASCWRCEACLPPTDALAAYLWRRCWEQVGRSKVKELLLTRLCGRSFIKRKAL
jgi:hypothetical protein